MRRRSRAGGEPVKARRRKAATLKGRNAPKAARSRTPSTASLEAKVARLARELNEALQQQRATAEVLGAISRSKFELQSILQSVVDTASRLCRADASVIFRLEGGVYRFAAGYSLVPEYIEHERRTPISPGPGTLIGRAAMSRQVVRIEDAWTDPLYEQKAAVKKAGGARSMMGVPLMREGEPIGVIGLSRNRIEPFAEHEIQLVTTFADQAAIAIENVRLFEAEHQRTRELTESLEQQTATSEVLSVISSSPGKLEPVFEIMLENAVRISGAKFGNLFLREGDSFRIGATTRSAPPAYVDYLRRERVFRADPRVGLGRLLQTKRPYQVADLTVAPTHGDKLRLATIDLASARSLIGVPMLKDDEVIGCIVIYRQEVRPFTDKQIELVSNFAKQAVIAIENTRLLNELRQRTADLTESLEQQTATAEVLQVINSSPGDLAPVFEAMLGKATQLCGARFGALWIYDGERFSAAAVHAVPPAFAEFVRDPLPVEASASLVEIVRGSSVVHVPDLAASELYHAGNPLRRAIVDLGGARTLLSVALRKDNALLGVFNIYRQEVRPFSDKQIELVKNFAAQAVIAIENTRLLNELRQRTADLTESLEQQTATSEVLQVISSSPGELDPVFQTILASAARICEAKFGNIFRWDGDALHVVATHNIPPAFAEVRRRLPLRPSAENPIGRMLATKSVVHVTNLAADERYIEHRDPLVNEAVELGGVRTFVAVPMLKENKLIGALVVYRQEVRPFTNRQIALVTNFAAQAVIAIENTRLLNELRESLQQQTATADVLVVISSSPGELEPVFEVMLENATRICEAEFGFLWLTEGAGFRLVALHGVPRALADELQREQVLRFDPETPLGRLAETKQLIHVADIRTEPRYIAGFPPLVALAEIGGARTLLLVPMLKDNALAGVISIYRKEVRSFTDKQIDLVRNFAAQAIIAIENARLLNELRQRTDELGRSVEELRALGEVSQAVNSTLHLENVLSTIVAKAVQLSGTDAGAIYVFDDAQHEFHLRATYGMDQKLIDALTQRHIGLDDPNVTLALAQHEPVQIADLKEQAPSAVNEIILHAGYRALLVAPLLRGEEIVGMLVVRRRTPGAFPLNTVDLIKTFAAQSAVAIENARLFQNVEASLEDLRTAQDRLIQTEKLASLGQLTAGIAHEIKNPLNFVNNFSAVSVELIDELREALSSAHLDSNLRAEISEIADMLQGNLDKVVQHGKRADSIVKNMLLHSRQGSGEHRQVDINALVDESLNLAYHGARAEKQGFNITLERSFDPAAGEADLFPQEITRVLLNLISNGFYAATKRKAETNGGNYEPTLAATTKNLGDSVEIRIRDNGTGIPPKVKERMFNPFFTTKPAGEGTGIGLSLSYDIIVKQHAGSIEVDTQPGEFTEFRLVLPRGAATIAKSGERK